MVNQGPLLRIAIPIKLDYVRFKARFSLFLFMINTVYYDLCFLDVRFGYSKNLFHHLKKWRMIHSFNNYYINLTDMVGTYHSSIYYATDQSARFSLL